MADVDLADEWTRISHTKPEEKDEAKAVRRLFGMCDRLYVKRSLAHKIAIAALALQTIAWLNEGASDQLRPLMSREDLRKALAFAGAASSDQNINRVLATIATDLSILGYRRRRANPGNRGTYRINQEACTVVIRGVRRVMYLAGPSALDRGEGDQRDELFIEPRYLDEEDGPAAPPLFAFDPQPFEFVVFKCVLERSVQTSRDEVRNELLGLFMGVSLMLHGTSGVLRMERVGNEGKSHQEEWSTDAKFECTSCTDAEPFASAFVDEEGDVCRLHGGVIVHPVGGVMSLAPLLAAWDQEIVRQIGFNLQLPFPEGATSDHVFGVLDPTLFAATIAELALIGPIVRRDAFLGDVVKVSPTAEMGVWVYAGSIQVRFWPTGTAALLLNVASFALDKFLRGILRRVARRS